MATDMGRGLYKWTDAYPSDTYVDYTATNSFPTLATDGFDIVAPDGSVPEIWSIKYRFPAGSTPTASIVPCVLDPAEVAWYALSMIDAVGKAAVTSLSGQVVNIPGVPATRMYLWIPALSSGATLRTIVRGMYGQ